MDSINGVSIHGFLPWVRSKWPILLIGEGWIVDVEVYVSVLNVGFGLQVS